MIMADGTGRLAIMLGARPDTTEAEMRNKQSSSKDNCGETVRVFENITNSL